MRRFRPKLCKRQIEFERSSGKRVHLRLLRGVKAVGGPDQCSKNEREQKRDEAHDCGDHIARTIGGMRRGQELLQTEAGDAEGESQGCDAEAYPNRHRHHSPRGAPESTRGAEKKAAESRSAVRTMGHRAAQSKL